MVGHKLVGTPAGERSNRGMKGQGMGRCDLPYAAGFPFSGGKLARKMALLSVFK